MLNPHFVAGEHGLFGGHKSEDIRTFFKKMANWVIIIPPMMDNYVIFSCDKQGIHKNRVKNNNSLAQL